MLYPLKFTPILKQVIWGGRKLAYKSQYPEREVSIGESWEISGVQENLSVVSEGFLAGNNLEELIEVYMGELVGDKVYEKFGVEFPLLIKYIDACQDLSIQVHPNDTVAKERHNAYGKTEMWYVADAESDAHLLIGFNKESGKSEYLDKLQSNTLPEILRSEAVRKGDCFFIPAGTVHAICKGCFIAEIQQTSDITYRLYDYGRTDKEGNTRELHTELATDVIDFRKQEAGAIRPAGTPNRTEELVSCDYFTTNYLRFDREVEKEYFDLDSFVIYMCLEGSFTLVYDTDKSVPVQKGETVLLPAVLKTIFLLPTAACELLEIYIR